MFSRGRLAAGTAQNEERLSFGGPLERPSHMTARQTALLLFFVGCSGEVGEMNEVLDSGTAVADASVAIDAGVSVAVDASVAIDASVSVDASVAVAIDAGHFEPTFIAGFNPSGFARSSDGKTWSSLQVASRGDAGVVPGDNAVTSLAFGLGKVVAVGDFGISVSRDGRNWQFVMPSRLHSSVVTFAFNQFIVLSAGDVWASPDGITWSKKSGTGDATHWHSLEFGRVGGVDTLIGVGDQWEFATDGGPPVAPHRLKRTIDGVNWEFIAAHRDTPEGNEQIDTVVIGNDIALGIGTKPGIVYRFDGSNWSQWEKVNLPSDGGTKMSISAEAFANGQFVFTGTGPYTYNTGATTTDARTWHIYPTTKGTAGDVKIDFVPFPVYGQMQFTGGRFIGPAPFHVEAWLAFSDDGIAWNATWAATAEEKAFGKPSVIKVGPLEP